ncbi:MAG: T9SS type A sorting domain-containing protein, partial [Bacteroidota bacterium]
TFNASDAVNPVDADGLFPDADLSISSNILTESFYTVSGTSFDLVGVRTRLDLLPDFEIVAPVSPVRATRRAPLNYEDSFSSTTTNEVIVSPDSIPPEALALIDPAIINAADSVRIRTIFTREDVVDAWGNVRLGDNFYDVLREKRTETIDVRVAVQRLPLPFTDVTSLLELSPQIAPFVGEQPTTTTYIYWNEDSVEPIVELTTRTDDDSIILMNYKRAQTTTSVGGPSFTQAKVKVYPNPASSLATFEMEGLERGTYTLSLIDMTGRRVAQREFTPLGNLTRLNLDVSLLPGGLYLYSLRNERGRMVATRRLQVRNGQP